MIVPGKRPFSAAMVVSLLTLVLGHIAYAQPEVETGQEKLAQTGMKFLSVSVDPRAAAMANAVTALQSSSVAMFYNPAGMARQGSLVSAGFGQTQWIADIDHNAASIGIAPRNGTYGVLGLSIKSVNYGEFLGTVRADNDRGYENIDTYSPTAFAVGLGYARALTDRFSVGGTAKYVRQSLGSSPIRRENEGFSRKERTLSSSAFDLGILYRTGFRSLNFAMSVRNFSQESAYVQESFELPLTFRVGVAMDLIDLTAMDGNMHSLLFSVDARRPRDYSEQLRGGLEYLFMNTFALRAGYTHPTDEQGISLGVGLHQGIGNIQAGFDYAYTQFGTFGSVNRFALSLAL